MAATEPITKPTGGAGSRLRAAHGDAFTRRVWHGAASFCASRSLAFPGTNTGAVARPRLSTRGSSISRTGTGTGIGTGTGTGTRAGAVLDQRADFCAVAGALAARRRAGKAVTARDGPRECFFVIFIFIADLNDLKPISRSCACRHQLPMNWSVCVCVYLTPG